MKIQHIIKRDGRLEKWNLSRIEGAVRKAFEACNQDDSFNLIKGISNAVQNKVNDLGKSEVHIEDVQDVVQEMIMQAGQHNVATAYITYRFQRAQSRSEKAVFNDAVEVIDAYMTEMNWMTAENANIAHSFQGMILHLSGLMQARYVLQKTPERIKIAHEKGFFHIHDLSFGLTGYCAGWSLKDLFLEGFSLRGQCSAGPAQHLDAAMGQMVNFLGSLQNEWAGAQAFNNVDTLLAPFVRIDGLTYKQVKQSMQKFVFNMNTTSRWGGQSPFTNLTFDLKCPEHMAKEAVIIGGVLHESLTYGDFQIEMDMINKAYLEVMLKGDYHGRIFSFPIPTYNVTEGFPWESENGRLLLKLTAKYGVPYFQNFINSDLDPADVRSMCCRLRMDLREIRKKTGGLFGAGDLTGSIGVITLNLPKLAYLADSEKQFFELLEEYAELAKESLELKRKELENNLAKGFYPYSSKYLKNGYKGHFSTIGLIGGHEACLNLLGMGIESLEGTKLMAKVLDFLSSLTERFSEETGNLYNLEATPGEGTSYRLARLDREQYSDIIQSGSDEPYYTNSTALPVGFTSNPLEALEHQNQLQPRYTGGTVFHTFTGEQFSDLDALQSFIVKTLTNTKLPFLSITPSFSICEEHGYLNGEQEECPHCGRETEVYTRIVGYYRPVKRWNKGKQAEKGDRLTFIVEGTRTAQAEQAA